MNNSDAARAALEAMLRGLITAQALRESVLSDVGDADWAWAAAHWADWLAQELAERGVSVEEQVAS